MYNYFQITAMEQPGWLNTLLRFVLFIPFIAFSVGRDVLGLFIPALKPDPITKHKPHTHETEETVHH
jgi:hypothetical protein